MWEFWLHQRRVHAINRYAFAPMLEQSALLLFNAAGLWYKWSTEKKKKLTNAGYRMLDAANNIRCNCWHATQCLIGEELGHNMQLAVPARMPVRSYNEKGKVECIEGTKFLVSSAFVLLKKLFDHKDILQKTDYRFGIPNLEETLEMLFDSNCIYHNLEFGYKPMAQLAVCGIYLECSTVAYLQADLESNYQRKNPNWKKSKKTPDAKVLARLSSELDIPIDELKEAYSSKYSSWWKIHQTYHNEAVRWMNLFVEDSVNCGIRGTLGPSINIPMPHVDGSTSVFGEEALELAEATTRIMIASMTTWLQRSKPNTSVVLPQLT